VLLQVVGFEVVYLLGIIDYEYVTIAISKNRIHILIATFEFLL